MKTILLIAALAVMCRLSGVAAPLTESTFTEIINDVNTLTTVGNATPAKLDEVLKAPERVRTGPKSRAELTAPDHTITRVGANTVFSYADSGRTLNLEKGCLLFHPPKGQGGGTIQSGGASAAVLGTTLIVSATEQGGFKVILLEGKGKVTLPNGKSVTLHAGQMVYVLPGGKDFSPVLTINLEKLVDGSLLVKGFSQELSSMSLILAAIHQQNLEIASGKATDTGVPADNFAGPQQPGNGLNTLNPGTYQNAVHQPLTDEQINQMFFNQTGQLQPTGPGGRNTTPVPANFSGG